MNQQGKACCMAEIAQIPEKVPHEEQLEVNWTDLLSIFLKLGKQGQTVIVRIADKQTRAYFSI